MLRFFTTFLIVVCFTNSAAIRAEAGLSMRQDVSHESVVGQSSKNISIANFDSKVSAPLSDENTNSHSDCDQRAACHHCHFGHCHFLVTTADDVHGPLGITEPRRSDELRFTSLEIPSPIRPPIA